MRCDDESLFLGGSSSALKLLLYFKPIKFSVEITISSIPFLTIFSTVHFLFLDMHVSNHGREGSSDIPQRSMKNDKKRFDYSDPLRTNMRWWYVVANFYRWKTFLFTGLTTTYIFDIARSSNIHTTRGENRNDIAITHRQHRVNQKAKEIIWFTLKGQRSSVGVLGAYAHGRLREEQPLCHQTLRSGGYRRRRRCWWWWRCHRWWWHCRRWMMLAALPLKAYRHPARIRPPEIAAELLPALWTSLDAYLAIVHVVIAVYAATSGTGHGYARVSTSWHCPHASETRSPLWSRCFTISTGTPGRSRINEKQ